MEPDWLWRQTSSTTRESASAIVVGWDGWNIISHHFTAHVLCENQKSWGEAGETNVDVHFQPQLDESASPTLYREVERLEGFPNIQNCAQTFPFFFTTCQVRVSRCLGFHTTSRSLFLVPASLPLVARQLHQPLRSRT